MSAERKKIESTIPSQFQLDQSSSNEITKDLEKKRILADLTLITC